MKKPRFVQKVLSLCDLQNCSERELALIYAGQQSADKGVSYTYYDYDYYNYNYYNYNYYNYNYYDYNYYESGSGKSGGRYYTEYTEYSNSYSGGSYGDSSC